VHTFCCGSPLTYYIIDASGALTKQKLGPPTADGTQPLLIVDSSEYKGAWLEEGEYCLLTEVRRVL